MNIHRVALYLSGNLPPYYGKPYDRLELLTEIESLTNEDFSKLYKVIDSEHFYSMCLNKLEKSDEKALKKLLKKLDVDEDAGGLSKEDKIVDELEILKKEYKAMKALPEKLTDKQRIERGNEFERWLIRLMNLFNLNAKGNIKNGVDQIDGSLVLDGQIIIFEAEWIDKNSSKNYIVEVSDKASYMIGTLGLAIAYKGFASTAFSKIKTITAKNVLLLSGKDIEKVLNKEIRFDDLLRKIKRRGAEKGKPYLD